MICKFCGTVNGENAKFCHGCGKPLVAAPAPEIQERVCPYCGGKVGAEAMFCRHCGNRLDGADVKAEPETEPVPEPMPAGEEPAPVAETETAELWEETPAVEEDDPDETIILRRYHEPEPEEDLTVIMPSRAPEPEPEPESEPELPPGTMSEGNAFWQEPVEEPEPIAESIAEPEPVEEPEPEPAAPAAFNVAPAASVFNAAPQPEPAAPEPAPAAFGAAPQPEPQPEPAAPAPQPAGLVCPACGGKLRPGIRFCGYCGSSVMKITGAEPEQKTGSVPVEELRKLKGLLDEEIITREEFDAMKKKLLDRM